jgi:hypothetical protein
LITQSDCEDGVVVLVVELLAEALPCCFPEDPEGDDPQVDVAAFKNTLAVFRALSTSCWPDATAWRAGAREGDDERPLSLVVVVDELLAADDEPLADVDTPLRALLRVSCAAASVACWAVSSACSALVSRVASV